MKILFDVADFPDPPLSEQNKKDIAEAAKKMADAIDAKMARVYFDSLPMPVERMSKEQFALRYPSIKTDPIV